MEMDESDDDDDDDDLDDDEDEEMDDDLPPPQPEPQEEDAAILRRREIQRIMRDTTISEQEKRMRIQTLMSGGRTEIAPPPAPIIPQQQDTVAVCTHYERNCNVVAPCCGKVFGCRICHDELSPPGHPPMDRFAVREVICKLCDTRQPASYVFPKVAC